MKYGVVVAIPNFHTEVEAASPIKAAQVALDRFAEDRRASNAALHVVTTVAPSQGLSWFRTFNLLEGKIQLTEWGEPDDTSVAERAFSDEAYARDHVAKLLAAIRRLLAEHEAMRRAVQTAAACSMDVEKHLEGLALCERATRILERRAERGRIVEWLRGFENEADLPASATRPQLLQAFADAIELGEHMGELADVDTSSEAMEGLQRAVRGASEQTREASIRKILEAVTPRSTENTLQPAESVHGPTGPCTEQPGDSNKPGEIK